jgi:thymidine kinase
MAKLYFSYAAMNAGKSTILLQAAHNYRERGMRPLLLTAALDDRAGQGVISSRIGLSQEAIPFTQSDDLFALGQKQQADAAIDCLFVDEAQFLTEEQVWQLARIADELKIPVLCYGLRTDFQGQLFPGSATLLAIADNLREIRTICWCGAKASMVLRLDASGQPVTEGEQVVIGGNESYVSLCRKHWHEQNIGPAA